MWQQSERKRKPGGSEAGENVGGNEKQLAAKAYQ